jgi:hypothetical protein
MIYSGMRVRPLVVAFVGLLTACREPEPVVPAPSAEFIIAAGDSVFWVRSEAEGIRVRGAPMLLAQVGGRFAELYTADADLSFYDAVYVGQRLYKRDLISGDSVALFADTLMGTLARAYASANPDERPLDPDEQGSENPRTVATSDIEVLDVHGNWVSYEYRTDVDIVGGASSHGARRGVIDLRTASTASLDALLGAPAARKVVQQGRDRWTALRDSLLTLAADSFSAPIVDVERLSFEPKSFILAAIDGLPHVRFAVAQSAAADPIGVVELDPMPVAPPAWWPDVRSEYPESSGAEEQVWKRADFDLVGRPADTPTARTAFVLRNAQGKEWRLGSVPSPVLRVMWVSDSTEVPGTRDALTKAFNEAAFYSGEARIVRHDPRGLRARTFGPTAGMVRYASRASVRQPTVRSGTRTGGRPGARASTQARRVGGK